MGTVTNGGSRIVFGPKYDSQLGVVNILNLKEKGDRNPCIRYKSISNKPYTLHFPIPNLHVCLIKHNRQ